MESKHKSLKMISKLRTFFVLILFYSIECQESKEFGRNSTDISIISNTTEINSTTESPIAWTVEPMTTTVSSGDPLEEEPLKHYIHYNEDYCVCDLHLEWCDINCCCDIDCSDSEKFSFSECIETRKQIYDSRYCSNKNIVYINNTQTTIEISSNGLLCIVWDNTNERHLLDDVKPINDVNRLFNITPQHHYSWKLTNVKRVVKSIESEFLRPDFRMKSGKYLLIGKHSNDTLAENWELPDSMIFRSGECNSMKKVKYLNDFNSSCYRFIRNLSQECLQNKYLNANHFKSFDFLSKSFLNRSENKIIYINITSDHEFKDPELDSNKVCKNSVKSVEYIIRHNGSYGIIDQVELKIQTIHIQYNTQWFQQTFGVSFIWFNKSKPIELSGNPGYILGKPVLAAFRSEDKNLTQDFKGYRILTQTDGPFCDNNPIKKSIEFGINLRSGCLLKVSTQTKEDLCKSIDRTIRKVLEAETDLKTLNAIGVFGNSSTDLPSDWVSISEVGSPTIDQLTENTCPILVTGISLQLYYAMTGSVDQPQQKIVGAVKKMQTKSDIRVKCRTNSVDCNDLVIELSTSVTFIDISKPSRPDYAPPVTFKIELPSDFFYPFLTSSMNYSSINKILLILIIIYLFLIYNQR